MTCLIQGAVRGLPPFSSGFSNQAASHVEVWLGAVLTRLILPSPEPMSRAAAPRKAELYFTRNREWGPSWK
jgi:hypothetical protein